MKSSIGFNKTIQMSIKRKISQKTSSSRKNKSSDHHTLDELCKNINFFINNFIFID